MKINWKLMNAYRFQFKIVNNNLFKETKKKWFVYERCTLYTYIYQQTQHSNNFLTKCYLFKIFGLINTRYQAAHQYSNEFVMKIKRRDDFKMKNIIIIAFVSYNNACIRIAYYWKGHMVIWMCLRVCVCSAHIRSTVS